MGCDPIEGFIQLKQKNRGGGEGGGGVRGCEPRIEGIVQFIYKKGGRGV